jgi:hypothetical protein
MLGQHEIFYYLKTRDLTSRFQFKGIAFTDRSFSSSERIEHGIEQEQE